MLSVTLTIKPITLIIRNCHKLNEHVSMQVRNVPQSDYLTICGLAVTLTFDLLTSKSN